MRINRRKIISTSIIIPLFMAGTLSPAAHAEESTPATTNQVNPGITLKTQGNFSENANIALTKSDGSPIANVAIVPNGMARVNANAIGDLKQGVKIKVSNEKAKLQGVQCVLKEVNTEKVNSNDSGDSKVPSTDNNKPTTSGDALLAAGGDKEEKLSLENSVNDKFDWVSATVDQRYDEYLRIIREMSVKSTDKDTKEFLSNYAKYLTENKAESLKHFASPEFIKSVEDSGSFKDGEENLGLISQIAGNGKAKELLKKIPFAKEIIGAISQIKNIPFVGDGLPFIIGFLIDNIDLAWQFVPKNVLPPGVDKADVVAVAKIIKDLLDGKLIDDEAPKTTTSLGVPVTTTPPDEAPSTTTEKPGKDDDTPVVVTKTTSADADGENKVTSTTKTTEVTKATTVVDTKTNSVEKTVVQEPEDTKVTIKNSNAPALVNAEDNSALINVSGKDEVTCMLTVVNKDDSSDKDDNKDKDKEDSKDGDQKSNTLDKYLEDIKSEAKSAEDRLAKQASIQSANQQAAVNQQRSAVAAQQVAGPKVDTGGHIEKKGLLERILDFFTG